MNWPPPAAPGGRSGREGARRIQRIIAAAPSTPNPPDRTMRLVSGRDQSGGGSSARRERSFCQGHASRSWIAPSGQIRAHQRPGASRLISRTSGKPAAHSQAAAPSSRPQAFTKPAKMASGIQPQEQRIADHCAAHRRPRQPLADRRQLGSRWTAPRSAQAVPRDRPAIPSGTRTGTASAAAPGRSAARARRPMRSSRRSAWRSLQRWRHRG